MNNSHEIVINALFNYLVDSIIFNFTGSGSNGSPVVNISSVNGLFVGLPIFGPNVPSLAAIESIDPSGTFVTLDQDLTGDVASGAFKSGFVYTGRRAKLWTEMKGRMPSFFLRHPGDDDEYSSAALQKTTLECEAWIYTKAGQDPNRAPDTQLNNLATAVRQALAPNIRGLPQTLASQNNGQPLVQWARVEGHSAYDPGDLDDFGKCIIPIKVLCP